MLRRVVITIGTTTFKQFAETYLRDHAELHKKSVGRDREILKVLNRSFGPLVLHAITTHRVEQFMRERLAGKWRGHNVTKAAPAGDGGYDDYTVMAISGHSGTRMLSRYTHPSDERKVRALTLPSVVTNRSQSDTTVDDDSSTAAEIAESLKDFGGRREARIRDLRVANAAVSHPGSRRRTLLLLDDDVPPLDLGAFGLEADVSRLFELVFGDGGNEGPIEK